MSRARCACRREAARCVSWEAKHLRPSSGSLLEDGEGIILKGTPSSITSTLTKLEYISALDWHGSVILSISWRTTAAASLVAIR